MKGEVLDGPGSLALGGCRNPAKACGGKAAFLNIREQVISAQPTSHQRSGSLGKSFLTLVRLRAQGGRVTPTPKDKPLHDHGEHP